MFNCPFLSDSWDCVATCFFIDTAHNVIEYVETIWKILKPGGVWINLGESLSVRQLHVNSTGEQNAFQVHNLVTKENTSTCTAICSDMHRQL